MRLPQILSITNGPKRATNIELLRIVAMFLVLAVHANFVALGYASKNPEGAYAWTSSITRTFLEMAAMTCVNLFVLISGWFGIKATVKGFANFAFQCFFYLVLTYLAWLALTGSSITMADIKACFCLSESNWFIKAYAALFLLSPMLNLFAEKSSEKSLRIFVVLFFLYEFIWGWIGINNSVDRGYTAFSFIGIYMLARYMRLHYRGTRNRGWLITYLLMTLLSTLAYYLFPPGIDTLSYVSPFVVVGSLCLFMWFTTLKIKFNPYINFIAASAFAVYLLNTAPKMMGIYKSVIAKVFEHSPGPLSILAVAGAMVLFFACAVLLDQTRIVLWHYCVDKCAEPLKRKVSGTARWTKWTK